MTTQIGRLLALATMLVISAACGDDTAIVVTVDARDQVLGTASIQVTAINDGESDSQRFSVGSRDYPLTFSVTVGGRSGDIDIEVVALDEAQLARGVGTVTGTILDGAQIELDVLLDPADFVVNTSTVGSQKSVFKNARNGRQLGVNSGTGEFFVPFVDDCSQSAMECNIYGRLFDQLGAPRVNETGGDSNEFQVNLEDEVFGSVPAIAVGAASELVVFELFSNDVDDIRAVLLNESGGHITPLETVVVSGAMLRPSDPDCGALANSEYVVVWSQVAGGGREIRGRLLGTDGLPIINGITGDALEFPISETLGVTFNNPNVFATGNDREFAVVWEGEDNVFIKFFDNAGLPASTEFQVTAFPAGGTVFGPKVQILGDGNAIVTWGVHVAGDVDLERGAHQIGKFSAVSGAALVNPITVSGPLLEEPPPNGEPLPPFSSPALAGKTGEIAVTWHECLDIDGALKDCDVFAQLFDEELSAVGPPVVANTTLDRNQESPSIEPGPEGYVTVWTDESLQEPDTSLASVRARVLFFPAPSPE